MPEILQSHFARPIAFLQFYGLAIGNTFQLEARSFWQAL
jgi:hypothetical protein